MEIVLTNDTTVRGVNEAFTGGIWIDVGLVDVVAIIVSAISVGRGLRGRGWGSIREDGGDCNEFSA